MVLRVTVIHAFVVALLDSRGNNYESNTQKVSSNTLNLQRVLQQSVPNF